MTNHEKLSLKKRSEKGEVNMPFSDIRRRRRRRRFCCHCRRRCFGRLVINWRFFSISL